ncbi:MAG TPA: hypothetical protein VHU40_09510 [Polyangia bacterium]|nr:hypothetical protein [Polyangia bacterium]
MIVAAAVLLLAGRAEAYPWMIKNDHPACAQCHMDPSGGGLLTSYGREIGEAELPMRYGPPPSEETLTARSGFALGLVHPPDWLLLGVAGRYGMVVMKPGGTQLVLMQADARAGVRWGGFRALVSAGGIDVDSSPASVASNLVSREHWLGWAFGSGGVTVRAGRLNVPFGLRTVEHTFWVRQTTRTDINDTQQHGAAVAFATPRLRGEVMAILGNYQLKPAARRQRGYSGYAEFLVTGWAGIGVSSLVTHADIDAVLDVAHTRQAHGLFVRVAPIDKLALLAEGDLLLDAPTGLGSVHREVGLLQADFEPRQGLHVIGAFETKSAGLDTSRASFGGWLGVDYFFLPRLDLRVDGIRQALGVGEQRLNVTALIAQLHIYI